MVEYPESFGKVSVELLKPTELCGQMLRKRHPIESTVKSAQVKPSCLQPGAKTCRDGVPFRWNGVPRASSHPDKLPISDPISKKTRWPRQERSRNRSKTLGTLHPNLDLGAAAPV